MEKNRSNNSNKKLSLIDKLVLVSWAVLIISYIFALLFIYYGERGFTNYELNIIQRIIVIIGLCFEIGGDIFAERIGLSILLIEIFVILQVVVLVMSKNTFIRLNNVIKVINIMIWCLFNLSLFVGNICLRL